MYTCIKSLCCTLKRSYKCFVNYTLIIPFSKAEKCWEGGVFTEISTIYFAKHECFRQGCSVLKRL